MSTSITAVEPRVVFGPEKADLAAPVRRDAHPAAGASTIRKIREIFGQAVLLLLAVYLFPVIILLVGTPIALFLRIVIEIAHRIIG